MRIVLALKTIDDEETLDACLSFHLNVGVDAVVAVDEGSADRTPDVLRAYEREGVLRLLEPGRTRTDLARTACELGADWVVHADGDEFLWPRGYDLREVMSAIPARYQVVRGLVRVFVPRSGPGSFAERRIARLAPSTLAANGEVGRPTLRAMHRGILNVLVEPDAAGVGGAHVPLRGWYPIEVLRFPGRSREPEGRWPEGSIDDERLRDALRVLRRGGSSREREYAMPAELSRPLELPLPGIVDDALYAVDVAAAGEASFSGVQRQLDRLEDEVARRERRLGLRMRRRLSRLARRR